MRNNGAGQLSYRLRSKAKLEAELTKLDRALVAEKKLNIRLISRAHYG